MKYILFCSLLSVGLLSAMEQKAHSVEYALDYKVYEEQQKIYNYTCYVALKKIQEIINKHVEKKLLETNWVKLVPGIHSVHPSTTTKQGLFFKVTNNRLDAIYAPWGQMGLPKFRIFSHLYEEVALSTSILEGENIRIGTIAKTILDGELELYPILEVDNITLPPAQKLDDDTFDDAKILDKRALLASMEKRYMKENKK